MCAGAQELESLVELVQREWVREALWGVPTTAEALWEQQGAHGGADAAAAVTPQVLPLAPCAQP